MSTLRVKPGVSSVVMLSTGVQVHLKADMAFDSSDPIVADICRETGCTVDDWFQVDGEAEAPKRRTQSVRVENAMAVPGKPR